ncbi:MAG TPA: lipopolysaccharide kinase InaA family protein [Candidatus Binatia bacterium]|nr:lipopolysaccharide kinase InaA family protein [Candidatus Binatia bacterium]
MKIIGMECTMAEPWLWGYTPPGFKRIRAGREQMGIVRETLDRLSLEQFKQESASGEVAPDFFGRSQLKYFCLDNGQSVLIRAYRRGGWVRRVTKDVYFTWPPRPLKEAAITEEVRRRGIPTLEILAAWVERIWGPFYRGWLVSRELTGACDLWTALEKRLYVGREGELLLQNVAQTLRSMHRKGIYHRDLNLKNILVRKEGNRISVYIIDFDKARLFQRPVPYHQANRTLSRLLRSARKLDPNRQFFSQRDWQLLFASYRDAI